MRESGELFVCPRRPGGFDPEIFTNKRVGREECAAAPRGALAEGKAGSQLMPGPRPDPEPGHKSGQLFSLFGGLGIIDGLLQRSRKMGVSLWLFLERPSKAESKLG